MILPTYTPVHNWRGKLNQSGRYKIHIRAQINRDSRYYEVYCPLKVTTAEWSGKDKAWVKNTHPYAFEINNAIEEKLQILSDLNKRYYTLKRALSFPIIARELEKNFNKDIFNAYYEVFLQRNPEGLDPTTLKRYGSALMALNEYRSDIAFHELGEALFQDVKKFLKEQKKLVGSTIVGYFNAYRKVVHWSQVDGFISKTHQETIFPNIKIRRNKSHKEPFEVHEIKQWMEHVFEGRHWGLVKVRDMFLLQIYTGLYYNDLRELEKTELRKDHDAGYYIERGREKNDHLAIIPIWKFPTAIAIIDQYRDTDPASKYLLRRDTFMEDQVYNRRLKEVAKLLKWTRNVKNKQGRQTNAQLFSRFGAQRQVVSKILGHEKEQTANAYFTVNLKDVIEGTRNVDFERLGIA